VWFVDKPLTGIKLLAVGKLKKNKEEIKASVEAMGGKITPSANKADLCLSNKSTHPPSPDSVCVYVGQGNIAMLHPYPDMRLDIVICHKCFLGFKGCM